MPCSAPASSRILSTAAWIDSSLVTSAWMENSWPGYLVEMAAKSSSGVPMSME